MGAPRHGKSTGAAVHGAVADTEGGKLSVALSRQQGETNHVSFPEHVTHPSVTFQLRLSGSFRSEPAAMVPKTCCYVIIKWHKPEL